LERQNLQAIAAIAENPTGKVCDLLARQRTPR